MNAIKVGVIGVGNMGRNHVRVLSVMPEFEFVGLYDDDAEAARVQADRYGVTAFDSVKDLLDAVEAVHIATPSFLHKELACQAASAGCHVLVEKPIALTLPDADAIIACCKEHLVTLCVGHVERYNPAIATLADIVSHEEVVSVDFKRLSPFDGRVVDADVVQDLMIHDLDVLNWLIPFRPARVVSQGVRVYTDALDYAQALVGYEEGPVASLTASRVTESKVRTATINTRNAYIFVDYLNRSIEISRKTHFTLDVGYETQYRQESVVEKVFVPFREPLRVEFEEFARCIVSGDTPATSGPMARDALELCEIISAQAFAVPR